MRIKVLFINIFVVFYLLISHSWISIPVFAQQGGQLSSSMAGKCFYDIAYDLANNPTASESDIKLAVVLLKAARNLDNTSSDVRELLLELCCKDSQSDNTALVNYLFLEYVNQDADIELSRNVLAYLLDKLETRQQRQQLLETFLVPVGNRNTFVGSEIAMMLGMIEAEKPNLETAQQYLVQAYRGNRYNKQAFQRLQQLAPEQIGQAVFLERARLAFRENPTDLDAIINFAERAQKLHMFDTASAAYEYCSQLYDYLYPSQQLDSRIYLPWAICCYNSNRSQEQAKCLDIVERIRTEGRFDFTLECIAGRAALKLGNTNKASEILLNAAQRADTSVSGTGFSTSPVSATELAWFYCFVVPTEDRALKWASQAFSQEPASEQVASLQAYAYMMNNQQNLAQTLLDTFESTQIFELVRAKILIEENQKAQAIAILKIAIEKDPSSFAAEEAKKLVSQLGSKYSPDIAPDAIVGAMQAEYGANLVPPFTRPENIFTAEIMTGSSDFAFGRDITAKLRITNKSQEPIVINDDAIFKGNIRVDAVISGDLSATILELVSRKISTARLINSGQNMDIQLPIMTGRLKNMLQSFPQASLNIELTLYLDPVQNNQGNITNRLTYLQPLKVNIHRPAVPLSGSYLRDHYMTIFQGQMQEKIDSAGLFIALLKELNAMSNRTPPYKFMYAEWEPELLKQALIHQTGLLRDVSEGSWIIKVFTMTQMLTLQLDYDMIQAVTDNLNSTDWPVRLMAVYLLSKTNNNQFTRVLEGIVSKDENEFVRNLAEILRN